MNVHYLKTEQGNLPIRIGYSALRDLKAEHGINFTEIKGDDLEVYETLLFSGLKSGYRAIKEDCPFKVKEDVYDILEDHFFDFLKLFPSFFAKEEEEVGGDLGNADLTPKEQKKVRRGQK